MNVTKRAGKVEPFNEDKILACVDRACDGNSERTQRVFMNAKINLYDGVRTSEIDLALIKSSRALIEKDPSYKFVASRLLLNSLYKEVFGESSDRDAFELQYRKTFIVNLRKLIKAGIINKELAKFDLKKISDNLVIERDYNFAYLGLQTVYDRYLMHINDVKQETPQAFFMRVAMGLAVKEDKDKREEWAIKFYNVLSKFDFMCSTPTLFNSGGTFNQLSSCFLNTFEDSMQGIFDGLHQEALKNKYAGGLGMDLTNIRATNSYIRGTNGYTQGAVYFWKLFGDMLTAVNQGGKRRGAGCAYLEVWHADFEDFIQLRKNTGDDRKRAHDMNTASWIPDLFIERVRDDGDWYLMSPNETPDLHGLYGKDFEKRYKEYTKAGLNGELRNFKQIKAKDLWKKMLRSLFETGHPWVTFKDPSNIRYSNQHEGTVHSSNLCTEILLHTKPTKYKDDGSRGVIEYGETAVCNLGSLNLANHIIKDETIDLPQIDYPKLRETISIAMRMLDNVIDINYYPTKETAKSNLRHRPVGLGSMGWHDVYMNLGINFDSEEAVRLSSDLYEFISHEAISSSCLLAKERGPYESYDGSLWQQNILPADTYRKVMKKRSARALSNKNTRPIGIDWVTLRENIDKWGMRNSNTMAIAPTATISSIIGCSPSIEPYYSVLYVYSTLSGEFTMINEYFVKDMKAAGLWSEAFIDQLKAADGDLSRIDNPNITSEIISKYKTAFQQDQFKLIDAAAARQRWIDQGQSLNLYNDQISLKYLNDLYMHAWESGLKTTYYLRNKAASSVEKSTVSRPEPENITACGLVPGECDSCQ
jgi:ribonucleoside-diphosphate reductase alpha chain